MKGSIAILDEGRGMAALVVDGRLQDLLVDPAADNPVPRPEAIYRGILDRPLKGMHGAVLRLPDGQRAFLKDAKGLSPGTPLLVQVTTYAEAGKAAPVVRKLLFKSRYAIVTPANPGINIARSIRDEEERDRLLVIAHDAVGQGGEGVILRSDCNGVDADMIADDIAKMLEISRKVTGGADGTTPELLLDAPNALDRAWRDWPEPDQVVTGDFGENDVLEMVEAARAERVELTGGAWISIEPTRALVAIDVNTGGDFSPAAGLKANLSAVKEISRQMKLRGLGGQITVDFAPMPKKDRLKLENALKSTFRRDGVDTILAGWTPLGNFEMQRKRERFPLSEVQI